MYRVTSHTDYFVCLRVGPDRLFDLEALRRLQVEFDKNILIEFYNATNGPEWKANTNWCSDFFFQLTFV